MLKDSDYRRKSATTEYQSRLPTQTALSRNPGGALRSNVKYYRDSDGDVGDEEDEQEDDDNVSREPTGASGHTSGSRNRVPLTSMPPRADHDHKYKEKKYEKVLVLFKKLKTEPDTYYLESRNPCDNCLGVWPCIMKRNAPKCRTCHGLPCSFYDPNAVETEPESPKSKKTSHKTNHKKTERTRSSSSSISMSDEDLQFLKYLFSCPVDIPEKSRSDLTPARKEVVDDVVEKESDEEEIDHNKTKPDKPSSSRVTMSKLQLRELLYHSDIDSSPVKPPKKTKRSKKELAPVRKEVAVYVENEESDEEQISHKPTEPTESSSSRATSYKRQVPELPTLPYVDPGPVKPQKRKMPGIELATAREVVVIVVEDEESDEEHISHKTDHEKTKATKPSSSQTISSKRQLPELSSVDSSPVEPSKTKKSRVESAPAKKVVVDDDEDEESDEEKYEHNSRTCRRLLDKLESQKWYKRLEGKGHCLRDLVEMEKLHWRSINGPKGRRLNE